MTITLRHLPFVVLLIALLWGSAFSGIKAIYHSWEQYNIEPSFFNNIFIAGVRFTLAGFILFLFSSNPVAALKEANKKHLISFSLFQTYFQYIFFYSALFISSGILGSLLASTSSFWWILLAPILLKTPWPSVNQWILFILGGIGVTLAVYAPGSGNDFPLLGTLLYLSSTLSGALAIILFRKLSDGSKARSLTAFSLFSGGILLTLTGIPSWHLATQLFTPTTIIMTVYLALVSAICFNIWNHMTNLFSVNLLAGYRFIIPVCATIESTLFIKGEAPGWGIFIGGTIIIFSIISLQRISAVKD